MNVMRDPGHQTKKAMFWCALVAQCADEPTVTANRIAASLLRTTLVEEFCADAQLDITHLRDAVEDPAKPFDECQQKIRSELAAKRIAFASNEHQASVQPRPLDPRVKPVFDGILERYDRLAIPPLDLLNELIRADAELARRLASHGWNQPNV